jgi:hypothetical protein
VDADAVKPTPDSNYKTLIQPVLPAPVKRLALFEAAHENVQSYTDNFLCHGI